LIGSLPERKPNRSSRLTRFIKNMLLNFHTK